MKSPAVCWPTEGITNDGSSYIDQVQADGAVWLPDVVLTGEPVSLRRLGARVLALLGHTLPEVTWSARSFMEQRAESVLKRELSAIRHVTGLHTSWSRGSLAIWVTVVAVDADAIRSIAEGLQAVWAAVGYVDHRLWVVDDPCEVPRDCRDLLPSRP
jgi:hypothetical protein